LMVSLKSSMNFRMVAMKKARRFRDTIFERKGLTLKAYRNNASVVI